MTESSSKDPSTQRAPQRPLRRWRVAARDGVWLQESASNPMLINSVFVCDRMPLETFQELWRQRIMTENRYPRFQRRVVRGRFFSWWQEDPEFELERHIFLAPPLVDDPDALRTREQFQGYLSGEATKPLPDDRPLWQIQFIENFRENRSALYVRIHHVMADGMSLLPVVFSLMDHAEGDEEKMEQAKKLVAKPPNSFLVVLKTILLGPLLLLQKMLWKADRNVLHGPPVQGQKRVAWTPPIDIKRVKDVKNAYGTSLNDILMTALAAAFERYARDHGAPLETLRMSMPVNVRASSEEPKMENKFAAVMLDLPVGYTEPRAHAKAMNEYLSHIKSSVEPLFTYGTVLVLLTALPASLSRALIDWLANKCTNVVSNVPGPQHAVYLAGYQIRSMMFWVPQRANIAVGVSMISFDGRLSLGIIADSAIVPDPQELVDNFCLEFQRLREEVGVA